MEQTWRGTGEGDVRHVTRGTCEQATRAARALVACTAQREPLPRTLQLSFSLRVGEHLVRCCLLPTNGASVPSTWSQDHLCTTEIWLVNASPDAGSVHTVIHGSGRSLPRFGTCTIPISSWFWFEPTVLSDCCNRNTFWKVYTSTDLQ
jgi:hypothetical protein